MKPWFWAVPISVAVVLMAGCQEKPAPQVKTVTEEKQNTIPLIQAKVTRVELSKKQYCDEDGCTQYDLQTIQTGVPWIDSYFLNRIKKDVPDAFAVDAKARTEVDTQKGLNQNTIYVQFIAQHYNLATFAIQSYIYSAGAAHGMSHQEFVTFDLTTHKRLALTDILKPNVEAKVADVLYEANMNWLQQHNIERAKLQLSDNYYFGVNGIVFVYPLYELASYAEGMSELTLPYVMAKDLVKTEYLPSLPEYSNP
ncbi:hypothetical protein B9T28_05830 [Acinetobacter silvestris]|uniref:DUF3298 domain-containing protein n=2 Tax=Acinetobacter silvestris TaxID=1977882 RepID=A0A1Y3CNU1_9GAMM|nr:hypothetical protein B9T28_05830 [Acinetobacter silvestris]